MTLLKIVLYLSLNVASSITVILLNKWIYAYHIFPNVTLTTIHFITTFLGLWVCQKMKFFTPTSVRIDHILILSLCFCGFVVLTNLSLEYNSVGTYQVAKMLTTPGVMIIQVIWYNKTFPLLVVLTLIPVIAGIVMCFFYDIYFAFLGGVFAVSGAVITSLYQVLVNAKQSELKLDSMQLLYYQAPLSAVCLGLTIPFLEPDSLSFLHAWSFKEVLMVIASCSAALFVNLTTYWILGNASPLTYNMLGHSKFVLITVGGAYLFEEQMAVNQVIGILITFLGVVSYAHLMLREKKKQELKNADKEMEEGLL